jgi:single-strand DNA-binding protein
MNLNKVYLIGRLTQDPEVRTTPSGQNVATVKVATNRVWKDQSGQKKEQVEFHTVICWGWLADTASKYLKKGGLAMFEGRLQTRNWTGQDNVKRYTTEIIAESLQLGPRSAGAGMGAPTRESYSSAPAQPAVKRNAPAIEDIPIIDENEPVSVDEDELSIKKEDLPF